MVNHYLKEVNQNRLCVYYDGMGQYALYVNHTGGDTVVDGACLHLLSLITRRATPEK